MKQISNSKTDRAKIGEKPNAEFHLRFNRRAILARTAAASFCAFFGNIGFKGQGATAQGRGSGLESRVSMQAGRLFIELTSVAEDLSIAELRLFDMRINDRTVSVGAGAENPNLSHSIYPLRRRGKGTVLSEIEAPLEKGTLYLLSYDVLQIHQADSKLFIGAKSPFERGALPATLGRHSLLVRATDVSGRALMRLTGDLTLGEISCRKAEWELPLKDLPQGDRIGWSISIGDQTFSSESVLKTSGEIYVSPDGDDATGTGSKQAPFRTPQMASDHSKPGDTIFLRPGTYPSFIVSQSGLEGQPIIYTTLPGEERKAIIQGDLKNHQVYGGTGGSRERKARAGVRIEAKNYIHVMNLTIQDFPYEGIYVVGGGIGEQFGHHKISANLTKNTGNAGIFVLGFFGKRKPSEPLPRTVDVVIEHNDVSQTNVLTDFNRRLTNGGDGSPGGANESITVSSSCGEIVTRFNDIHDSRQYGIDYKAGVLGGAIYGNRIWNIDRHAIYIDSGRNTVRDIDIYNNEMWRCNNGIVLAREADENEPLNGVPPRQSLININVFNNVIYDMNLLGLYCQRHKGDGPHGEITNVRICFNTVLDCNRSGKGNDVRFAGWGSRDFRRDKIVSGFECIGNLVFNSRRRVGIVNKFAYRREFKFRHNFWRNVDPLFEDHKSRPPNLALRPDSPAFGILDPADVPDAFRVTANGQDRKLAGSVGAL